MTPAESCPSSPRKVSADLVLIFVSRRLFCSDHVSMMAKSGLLMSATPVRSCKYIPLSASSCAKAGVARAADARTAQVIIFFITKPPKKTRNMTNVCDPRGGGRGEHLIQTKKGTDMKQQQFHSIFSTMWK